jgi:hypothetical protein
MSYVVFLQNAWSPQYAGRTWPRTAWLHALARSRSGQRLRLLVDDLMCCYNTTPLVGATPGSILPPDLAYMRDVLAATHPAIVITCGRQAEQAGQALWEGPLLAVPHPASRVLTNALYERARGLITSPYTGRYALRQHRGTILLVPL